MFAAMSREEEASMADGGHTYDPVSDYLQQTGLSLDSLDEDEIELLKSLSRHEVDALVSIDNKGKQMMPVKRVGAAGY
jgi:hypothetical protein